MEPAELEELVEATLALFRLETSQDRRCEWMEANEARLGAGAYRAFVMELHDRWMRLYGLAPFPAKCLACRT